MGTTQFKERLRRKVLEQRGLERKGQGHLDKVVTPPDPRKTLLMRLLELQFGSPIEELLVEGNLEQVGEKLQIHFTTVSHWRERLGLR